MLKLSAKLLHFFELYKFFVKNTTNLGRFGAVEVSFCVIKLLFVV